MVFSQESSAGTRRRVNREALTDMAFTTRVQAVPLGYEGVSFQVDGVELVRYNTGQGAWRPYLFPVIAPSGRMLTRMGHPHDPVGHRHHYSVWLAHHKINELDFWSDEEDNKQIHVNLTELNDGPQTAWITCEVLWRAGERRALLSERRDIEVTYPEAFPAPGSSYQPGRYWYLDITSRLEPVEEPVLLEVTPFGFLGVRMAKSIGVADGGGTIRNSNGQVNESEVFAQPARWCDYSGWTSADVREGIAVFDGPQNFGHPAQWHVRDDGWMCPSQFRERAAALAPGESMVLHHCLLLHGDEVTPEMIEAHYQQWVKALTREGPG